MHFSIPETQEIKSKDGTYCTGYRIYVNGLHHCTMRYKQLRHLHQQLQNMYGAETLADFPPKKFFPLTPVQAEERRSQLEKYIQSVAQDARIKNSVFFQAFLRLAQNETHLTDNANDSVALDITLPGEEIITINVATSEQTDTVLKTISRQINLKDELLVFYGLFVYETDDRNKYTLVRRLLDYESTYLALKLSGEKGRLAFRKTYWDPSYEDELIKDPVGLKLVYNQMLDDLRRGWIVADSSQKDLLKRFMKENKKEECVRLGRQIRFYGGIEIAEVEVDYPSKESKAVIKVNNKELTFLYQNPSEMVFRITRIRSWRLTTLLDTKSCSESRSSPRLELSFEYLLSKDRLQWITVKSQQLVLLSLSLQSIVEELVRKQAGETSSNTKSQQLTDEIFSGLTYMKQDGTVQPLNNTEKLNPNSAVTRSLPRSRESMLVRFRSGNNARSQDEAFVENHAFTDIRDEDL